LAGFCLAVVAFWALREEGLRAARVDFNRSAEAQAMAVERILETHLARLQSLGLACLRGVDQPSFQELTRPWLGPSFPAESWFWAPRVSTSELHGFVQTARVEDPTFDIRDLPWRREAAVQETVTDFFPILRLNPVDPGLVGADLASSPEMATRLHAAMETGRLQVGASLLPDPKGRVFTILHPVTVEEQSRGAAGSMVDAVRLMQLSRAYLRSSSTLTASLMGPNGQPLYVDQPPGDIFESRTLPIAVSGLRFELSCSVGTDSLAAQWEPALAAALILVLSASLSFGMSRQIKRDMGDMSRMQNELEAMAASRAQAELAAQMAEERLLDLFENSQALLYSHDHAGILLQVNPAAARSLGYEPAEMVGKSLFDFALPTERQAMADYLEEAPTRPNLQGLHRLFARNGSTRTWLFHNSTSKQEIRGHALDVTDSKRAERELEIVSRQMQMILNSAGEGIFGVNLAGECSFVNPAAVKLTGHSADDLQVAEHPIHEILMGRRSDGSPYPWEESPLYATLQDEKVRRVTGEVMWRPDGTNFPVEYVCTALLDQDRVVGAVVTFQDVTERLAIEQMKDEFVSVVSHELRTPLTSIRGSLGLLASGVLTKAPEKAEAMIKIAVQNTDRLVRMINDILDIERLKSGRVSLEKRSCDLGDLMQQAGDVMEAMATTNNVKLVVEPQTVEIWADPDRILQVLTNLLSNAIKFSNPQGTVWLTAEPAEDGESVRVAVRDEGRGIPVDKLQSVFERFEQVEVNDSKRKGGTGLGLAICQTIVEQHGGRIWVDSVMGHGSTFQFVLLTKARANTEVVEEEAPAPTH